MLDTLFSYAGIGGKLIAHGDLHVDSHHLIEDVAICLGRALKGLRDRITLVQRYNLGIPMDDARSFCLLDIGGRFYYQSQFQFNYEIVANIPTEMFDHFFYTLAQKAEWTLHLKSQGDNSHHEVESLFKAVGKAISFAYAPADQLVSTKGVL
jgi:imidazoleglycerol-phosphate dehydratase/histidinol-phosphatase